MADDRPTERRGWQENDSTTFIDVGRIMIPRRDEIESTILALIPAEADEQFIFVDVAAGSGWLSKAVLERFPGARTIVLDGSETMLDEARRNLDDVADRVELRPFCLEADAWIDALPAPVRCVASSLAVHHLDHDGKRRLFHRLLPALEPGGAVLIADLVQPAGPRALRLAAREWDAAVRQQSLDLTDSLAAWELFDGDGWNIFDHPDPMDIPSRLADQIDWFREAGYEGADVFWAYAGHAVYGGFRPT